MLNYSTFSFTCILLDDAILPQFKGSTFRGALGGALKKVVCALKNKECAVCLLAERCLYARIFETKSRNTDARTSLPHPYILEPVLEVRARYNAKETFTFNLVLFSDFIDSLPYFIYAVETMGEQGIGHQLSGSNRAQFVIQTVSDSDGAVLYNSAKRIAAIKTCQTLPTPEIDDERRGSLHIRLLTPLRFKNDNHLEDALSFQSFVRSSLRRVSAMHSAYGDGDPPLDYRGIVAEAAGVITDASAIRWHDWKRYSNRQHDEMLFGGILGNISFLGNIGPFMQIVKQAKIMHIGKQTTFGLGLFDYRWEPDK